MLKLIINGEELFNEKDQTFSYNGQFEIHLEHSLVSVSKWESITEKPFLTREGKTPEEMKLYIRAMIISDDFPDDIVDRFSDENVKAVNAYIESKQTATTFGGMPEKGARGQIVTSELIYFWMTTYSIPFECQYWHLNRLLTLIRVHNVKTSKQKPMSKSDLLARNRALNAERKARLNTRG